MAIDKLPAGMPANTAVSNNQYNKQGVGSQTNTASTANTPSAKQDSVTLTPQAQRLSQVQNTLANAPGPDNSEKIASLKKAINEGTYQVDSDKLAANISRFEQDLKGI